MRRLLAVKLLLAACAELAAGAADAHFDHVPVRDHQRGNPMAANAQAIAAGHGLYMDHCAQCHKANARGDGRKKPSLRSETVRDATDGDLEWFLRQGDLRHGMPSWSSLPEEQRWEIIVYLRSLR
jgi:mono/diheme cytochrome c family protein